MSMKLWRWIILACALACALSGCSRNPARDDSANMVNAAAEANEWAEAYIGSEGGETGASDATPAPQTPSPTPAPTMRNALKSVNVTDYEAYIDVFADADAAPVNTRSREDGETENNSEPTETADACDVRLSPVNYGSRTLYRLGDSNYLITAPVIEEDYIKVLVKNRADQINELAVSHPNVLFYAYFVTRATDCDWYRKYQNIIAYDYGAYFRECLGRRSLVRFGQYEIANPDDYMATGYKTDFHINYIGSQKVYEDVYAMMDFDMRLSPRVEPIRVLDFDDLRMVGDLLNQADYENAHLTGDQTDAFMAYEYDLPPARAFINDRPVVLGLQEEYALGLFDRSERAGHQFAYYGGQTGMIRIEYDQPDRPNLLLLSDSQGRPSRMQIASHFNTTIYLDDDSSQGVDLAQVIEDNDIGVVLLIGQLSMFEQ